MARGRVHRATSGRRVSPPTSSTRRIRVSRSPLGFHKNLYRFSPSDYQDLGLIWSGPSPEDGSEVRVVDGPPEGGPVFDAGHDAAEFAPEFHPGELYEIAKKLYEKAK